MICCENPRLFPPLLLLSALLLSALLFCSSFLLFLSALLFCSSFLLFFSALLFCSSFLLFFSAFLFCDLSYYFASLCLSLSDRFLCVLLRQFAHFGFHSPVPLTCKTWKPYTILHLHTAQARADKLIWRSSIFLLRTSRLTQDPCLWEEVALQSSSKGIELNLQKAVHLPDNSAKLRFPSFHFA